MDFRRVLLDGVILILLGIVIALIVFNFILSKNKEGFTELYFAGEVPKTIDANQTYFFSFAIHNLEHKKTNYEYELYVQSNRTKQGYLVLEHDKTLEIEQNFSVSYKSPDEPVLVSVKILNKNQEIHFRVD
jgi:uncharacterized membrane protein